MTKFHYRDPVFVVSQTRSPTIFSYARDKNIDTRFLVDRFSLDYWQSIGCSPMITNSVILCKVDKRHNIVNLDDDWCGMYYYPYSLDDNTVTTKSYNCFINRMDSIRQSWLYQLIRRNIFDKGYVSFNMETERIGFYKDWDPHDAFQHQFETQCDIFHDEHEYIKTKVPYRNFTDNGDLTPVCYDSMISLVLETYFDNNDIMTYTEKTFRALQIPRPWLLFSHKCAVAHLRSWGFDTLDDVIDHAQYDEIDCPIKRQSKLLDILSDLIDQEFDPKILTRAAKNNQELLKKFSTTCVDGMIQKISEASELDQKFNQISPHNHKKT